MNPCEFVVNDLSRIVFAISLISLEISHPFSRYGRLLKDATLAAINNIIKRSLDATSLYSILEPVDLDWGDGRRPDGVTTFSFKGGKVFVLDAACTDSFSASNLFSTILNPGSASSSVDDLKRRKYSLLINFEFIPLAVESSRIIGSTGCSILTDVDRRISRSTNDPRHTSYIFQKISVAIIRSNALAMTSSLRRYAQK